MAEPNAVAQALARLESVETAESAYGTTGCHFIHTVALETIPPVAEAFARAGYYLEMLTALDMRATEQAMHLVYQFNRLGAPDRHRVRAVLPAGTAAPSIAAIFQAANWYEREAFDMLGVTFDGHPSLTRILTEEGADYHPLLKDFGVVEPAAPEASNG